METTAVSLLWMDVVKLALGTGFVAALINQGISWLRESRKEASALDREARYLALRVAATLEEFAINCAAVISDNIAHEQSGGNVGALWTGLPELPPYAEDVDWKSLDPDLASQSLSLRNQLSISNEQISAGLGIDHGFGILACNRQAGLRGYRAWQLASLMRQKYKLPAFDLNGTSWDLIDNLKSEHDSALEELQC